MTATREAFWRTLVDFVADHAVPDEASCRENPSQCPMKGELSLSIATLVESEDVLDVIDWMIGQLVREGSQIAHTRQGDGGMGLTGFAFDASRTSGMLAGALMAGRGQGNQELGDAARAILRFGPPRLARDVVSTVLEQLIGSLVERHRQMRGTKADA